MLIGRDYLLKKPNRPSGPKLFLDTQIVPLAANIAGALEVAVDRAAKRMDVRPALLLGSALGFASISAFYLWRHHYKAALVRSCPSL